MRYRLMATYRGVPYEAGVGPTDSDIVLFAACPPPEDLGFQPAKGHWRKPVNRAEVDAVWESRPSGSFRGEPCLVLDDLGEQLHIGYLGHDSDQAERLGYCQVETGVFEVLIAREEVTGITEERIDRPYPVSHQIWPAATAESDVMRSYVEPAAKEPDAGPIPSQAEPFSSQAEPISPDAAALVPPPRSRHGGSAAGPPRAQTRQTFAELVDLAAMPQDAYAVDEEVDGAMCLIRTDSGFEVFSASDGGRHEMRLFDDEESAYFYLFGLLAAEAVRDGRLVPPSS